MTFAFHLMLYLIPRLSNSLSVHQLSFSDMYCIRHMNMIEPRESKLYMIHPDKIL